MRLSGHVWETFQLTKTHAGYDVGLYAGLFKCGQSPGMCESARTAARERHPYAVRTFVVHILLRRSCGTAIILSYLTLSL